MTESQTAKLVKGLRGAGLSYGQIGEAVGVHWRTVHRWGQGKNQPPSAIAVNQILAEMLAKKEAENAIPLTP
tara:strand:+ start:2788 stop:3003 length:216 start_codon:yes stop_codon:yes gene_type:complete